jgi:conflict system STAND superfamily ATPase
MAIRAAARARWSAPACWPNSSRSAPAAAFAGGLPSRCPAKPLCAGSPKRSPTFSALRTIRIRSQIRRILNRGADAPAALADLLRDGDDNVCILIDQFEELFAFARQHGREEAQLFIDILVGLQENPPPGLYAILTMRSEFLGHCARLKGLAEAVNQTQYLLPQMERPALIRAIREPATLYDGEVSRALAERLIADAAGGQDQLPLIQHGLMRLYWNKLGLPIARRSELAEESARFRDDHVLEDAPVSFRHETGRQEPVARSSNEADDSAQPSFSHDRRPTWRLGLEDYRGGDLAMLLSDHADQVMAAAAPDPDREQIVEHLFRALTDINAEGSAIRRPQTFSQLAAVTGSDEERLRDIIDRFRKDGVSFLRPYGNEPVERETEIDISHEALIRCWRKIADPKDGWLQREFRDGLIWKTLRMQAQGSETLSAAATETRGAWLRTLPSPGWAERYGGWDDAQQLMRRSCKAAEEEAKRKQDLEEARRRQAEERACRAEEAHRAAAEIAAKQRELLAAQEQIAEVERRVRRRCTHLALMAAVSTVAALVGWAVVLWR